MLKGRERAKDLQFPGRIHLDHGVLGRTLFFALVLTLSSSPRLLAQTQSQVGPPFSNYQHELEAAADSMLADHGAWTSKLRVDAASNRERPTPTFQTQVLVHEFARRYWNGRYDDLVRAIARVQSLRASIQPILKSEGLPPDLLGVVLVESAGEPFARSPRGAYGLWQLMPGTAKRYGLSVSPKVDDRADEAKATLAAARYLKDLYARFGTWPLALAAYNAGEATVQTAFASEGDLGVSSHPFLQELPLETRNYVPAAIAARRLFHESESTTALHVEVKPQAVTKRIVFVSASSSNDSHDF